MLTVDFTKIPLKSGNTVLDLGCGEGRHTIAAVCHAAVTVVGLDLDRNDLISAVRKESEIKGRQGSLAAFVSGDALCLPFEDHCFDAVICSEVLEHIYDYKAVLAEVTRVLKHGGLFCASIPRRWPEKICWALSHEYHEVPGGHIRIFSDADLCRQIEQLGMSRYHKHWAHALHVPFWWLKCVFWKSQDTNWLIQAYHRLLVWDLMRQPLITRSLEFLLNPIMGKSVVLYFRKETAL